MDANGHSLPGWKLTDARREAAGLIVALERLPDSVFEGRQKTIEVLRRLKGALREAELRQELREAKAMEQAGIGGAASKVRILELVLSNPAKLRELDEGPAFLNQMRRTA